MEVKKHQLEIIKDDLKKCLIAYGTGGGKTAIALHLARGKTLIVAPKTQRDDQNWIREKEKWNLSIDLIVISKEDLRRDYKILPVYNSVIFDESHTVCGVTPNVCYRKKQAIPKTSQVFKACQEYLERIKPERIYLLTATPTRNPMAVLAAGWLLGRQWDFYQWRDTFYIKIPMGRREIWMSKKDKETSERLGKAVQSLGYTGKLENFVDLPPQVFVTKYLDLSSEQKKRLKEIPMDFPDPLIGALKKHQIENGILSGDEFSPAEEFKNEKLAKILDYSEEFPQLVIFARYTAQIAQIASALRKEGKKVLILNGATKNRGEVILEANNSPTCVFIAQVQMSAGFELPNYPCMVFASLDFSLVNYVQSLGRISRLNNPKRNLYIHLVAKGGVDEHVYKTVVEQKMDFHMKIYERK